MLCDNKSYYILNCFKVKGRNLTGILGTHAVLITDLTLLISIFSFVLLLGALVNKIKRKYTIHASIMGIALILHLITFLAAMMPSLVVGINFLTTKIMQIGILAMWIHAVSGALSLALGIFLIVAWIPKITDFTPCFRRKRIMDATTLLWTISLIFGIITYIDFYV